MPLAERYFYTKLRCTIVCLFNLAAYDLQALGEEIFKSKLIM